MINYKSIYNYNIPDTTIPGANAEGPLGDINRFKRVDRTGFNITDDPDQRFFKLLFYFYNDEDDNYQWDYFNGGSSGLLSPTWLDNVQEDYYKYNSAWAYLKNNFEDERADALEQFVTLLSQISSESPWYFQSISGVDEALSREKWTVPEERKKISITCLSDPVDHRIESLLSLYRSIVWSHVRKCEVLPANLRKFDMGLFIFSGPINGLHVMRDINGNQTGWSPIGIINNPEEQASYKYIEFHNCEISIDSIKSGYNEISNESGFEQKFTIDIYFDDCFEHEYNQFVLRSFGDLFLWDSWTKNGLLQNGENYGDFPDIKTMIDKYNLLQNYTTNRLNYFSNTQSQVNQNIENRLINETVNFIMGGLGNIYGNGYGIQGAIDTIEQTANQQIKNISNKVMGNINNGLTDLSRGVTQNALNPLKNTLQKGGTMVGDAIDRTNNAVFNDTLGPLYKSDQSLIVYSKNNENIFTNTKSNNIGKNRLNAKLNNL